MSRATKQPRDEMRAEYDIRGGVRGKYLEKFRQETSVVLLEPDVAAVFQDSAAVNRALRLLMDLAKQQAGAPTDRHT